MYVVSLGKQLYSLYEIGIINTYVKKGYNGYGTSGSNDIACTY